MYCIILTSNKTFKKYLTLKNYKLRLSKSKLCILVELILYVIVPWTIPFYATFTIYVHPEHITNIIINLKNRKKTIDEQKKQYIRRDCRH